MGLKTCVNYRKRNLAHSIYMMLNIHDSAGEHEHDNINDNR